MKRRIMVGGLAACVAAMALAGCAGPAFAGEGLIDITYTGDQSEFVTSGSELFAYVDNGLPGDVFAGGVTMRNASQQPCEVFVCAQDAVTNGPDDMLDRIPFVLETEDDAVFEGTLAEANGAQPVSLGLLQPGGAMSLDCSATIPSELTNEYADAAVGMNMAVKFAERGTDSSTDLVQTGSNTGAGLVHAGDMLSALPFVLGALGAAGAVIWCAWKRRTRMW